MARPRRRLRCCYDHTEKVAEALLARLLTVAHAAESLQQGDENGQRQAPLALDVEHEHHKEKDERRLAYEHRELVRQVGHHDLRCLDAWKGKRPLPSLSNQHNERERLRALCVKTHTCHDATVEQALLSLVDEDGGRQGNSNKVDNPVHFKVGGKTTTQTKKKKVLILSRKP